MAAEALPGPIGESRPYIPMTLVLHKGAGSSAVKVAKDTETLTADLSRRSKLTELASVVCTWAGLPDGGVTFVYEGRTLDLDGTLEENSILLPGPAAMKKGARLEIGFDFKSEVIAAEKDKEEAIKREEEMKVRREQMKVLEEKRREEEEKARREKTEREKYAFGNFVDQYLGVSEEDREALLADRAALEARREKKDFVDVDNHYLVPCDDEVKSAISSLLSGAGCTRPVIKVYKNMNADLLRRYERARGLLMEGATIERSATNTQRAGRVGVPPLDFLGPVETDVNEYPMWHGTPTANAAGGICSNGFDIAFAGAHGLAWGHGFYFADAASTSMGYAGSGFRISDEYPACSVMLLCRVLAGNIKKLSSPPSQEQKEEFTASCLGPGGNFGAKSQYHSICGGGWAYVCAHRDQVYPAYVIIYSNR